MAHAIPFLRPPSQHLYHTHLIFTPIFLYFFNQMKVATTTSHHYGVTYKEDIDMYLRLCLFLDEVMQQNALYQSIRYPPLPLTLGLSYFL